MTETVQQYSKAEINGLIRAELKASYPIREPHSPSAHPTAPASLRRSSPGRSATSRRRPTLTATTPPETCELAAGPIEAEVDALAGRYSSWEWNGDDGVRDYAPERLVGSHRGRPAPTPGPLRSRQRHGQSEVSKH